MGILYCDGERFRKAFIASASWLSENSDILNRLNVFPVPDGDTGTNMSLTLISAIDELRGMEGAPLDEILSAIARGTLMGARGCSGVILSQLFAGFSVAIHGKTRIGAWDIAEGLRLGTEQAYQAVTEPTEGTILTVIRESAEEAISSADETIDLVELLKKILRRAVTSLENTPNLLPILAQAGVVDAGGQGFVYMLEGILRLIHGDTLSVPHEPVATTEPAQVRVSESWDNPYCTEFILTVGDPGPISYDPDILISKIRERLAELGEDLIVVGWSNLIRVHVHTSDPERVLARAHSYGRLSNVKIDDMRKQHRHIAQVSTSAQVKEEREVSIVAVAPGDGISAICKSLGVEVVVLNDKAQNPSVSELLHAIDMSYSDNVLLLPNDNNVVPSAIQASKMSKKNVRVIHSKNISQGLSAVIAFRPDASVDDNITVMEMALGRVKHGEIARAVRNATYGDLTIKENDLIGLFDGDIHIVDSELEPAILKLLKVMVSPDNEVITIFYGAEIIRTEAEKIFRKVGSEFPEREVELHYGGQPYCLYILSVE